MNQFLKLLQGISSVDPQALRVWQTGRLPTQEEYDAINRTPAPTWANDPQTQGPPQPEQQDYFHGSLDALHDLFAPALSESQGSGTVTPPPSATPADTAEGGDPMVQGSRLKSGILRGGFRVGHTGGNILGALGDAFLAQAGRPLNYAPRVLQAREGEALQGFQDDPSSAVQRLLRLDTPHGIALLDKVTDREHYNAVEQAAATAQALRERVAQTRDRNRVIDNAMSLIGAASRSPHPEQTYAAARQRAMALLARNNINLEDSGITLPESYDANTVEEAVRGRLTPAQQQRAADQQEYFNLRRNDSNSHFSETDRDRHASLAERRTSSARADQARQYHPATPDDFRRYNLPAGGTYQVNGNGHVLTIRAAPRGRVLARPPREGDTRPRLGGGGTETYRNGRWG